MKKKKKRHRLIKFDDILRGRDMNHIILSADKQNLDIDSF